jgi:hypothetical protein
MVYGAQAWPPESNSNSSCPELVKHDQHHHAPAFSKRFRKIGRLMCDNYHQTVESPSESSSVPSSESLSEPPSGPPSELLSEPQSVSPFESNTPSRDHTHRS